MKDTKDKTKLNIFNGKTKVFAIVFICIILAISCTVILVDRHNQLIAKSQIDTQTTPSTPVNPDNPPDEQTYITNFNSSSTLLAAQTLVEIDGNIKNVFSQYLIDNNLKSNTKMTESTFNSSEAIANSILNIIQEEYTNMGIPLTESNIITNDELISLIGNLSDILDDAQK